MENARENIKILHRFAHVYVILVCFNFHTNVSIVQLCLFFLVPICFHWSFHFHGKEFQMLTTSWKQFHTVSFGEKQPKRRSSDATETNQQIAHHSSKKCSENSISLMFLSGKVSFV